MSLYERRSSNFAVPSCVRCPCAESHFFDACRVVGLVTVTDAPTEVVDGTSTEVGGHAKLTPPPLLRGHTASLRNTNQVGSVLAPAHGRSEKSKATTSRPRRNVDETNNADEQRRPCESQHDGACATCYRFLGDLLVCSISVGRLHRVRSGSNANATQWRGDDREKGHCVANPFRISIQLSLIGRDIEYLGTGRAGKHSSRTVGLDNYNHRWVSLDETSPRQSRYHSTRN